MVQQILNWISDIWEYKKKEKSQTAYELYYESRSNRKTINKQVCENLQNISSTVV